MSISELRTAILGGDPKGNDVLQEITRLGLAPGCTKVRTVKVYRFEGATLPEMDTLAAAIVDPNQESLVGMSAHLLTDSTEWREVSYKPGVMNPEAASIIKMARDLGCDNVVAASSSYEYHFYGAISPEEVETITARLLVNKTVQRVVTEPPETLTIRERAGPILAIPIRQFDDAALEGLSKERKLALNLLEMQAVRDFYREIDRDAWDAELEITAQWWSEHCGHKTFSSPLMVGGRIRDSLMKRLKDTSALYSTNVVSAFVDNAGSFRFYDGWAICGKVETHNSPSAIEPYGGAATGTGGVFRDVIADAEGAKIIASTDIFCLAPPDLPDSQLPLGCLRPDYLLTNVVRGVGDYGNRMGVPTNNGSVYFHPDFRAKPSVIVGAYGILPEAQAQKGVPRPGDLVIVIGGRTGRDGIHGATFSSIAMTEKTATVDAAAVQIGNAIEEKGVADVVLDLRDRHCIRAITDCGAGGLSSAVGEMGSDTGVHMKLEFVPLKYEGLAPWEITVSESQERMVLAVEPVKLDLVLEICFNHDVEATVIGTFTDDHRFFITHYEDVVCDLPMKFLKEGTPKQTLVANYRPPLFEDPDVPHHNEHMWRERFLAVMGHLNVCSKEPIARRYDYSVQGTSALTPFTGVRDDGPSDAAVLRPLLDKPYGMVISHGLNPILNRIDPYWGSVWACVEALANYAAAGGNLTPGEFALIDNFISAFPDEQSLGALDRSMDGCVDIMHAFEAAFISGKDSLSGTFRSPEMVIMIPLVLCISVFGRIPDVEKTMSSDFKSAGSDIVLLGSLAPLSLGGSVFYDTLGYVGNRVPRCDLRVAPRIMRRLYELITAGKLRAVHDVSQGGMGATLAEMCIGGRFGADVDLRKARGPYSRVKGSIDLPLGIFYNEMAGCYLVEVPKGPRDEALFEGVPHAYIGTTTTQQEIKVRWGSERLMAIDLPTVTAAWKRRMQEVFHVAA